MAVLVASLGYLAAEALTKQVSSRLPRMIPKPDLVGAAVSSGILAYAATYLPLGADAKRAAQLGAGIPTVKAIANAVGLGNVLGTAPIIMLAPPSGGALPAPLSAALNAQLEAALNGHMEDSYSPEY